MNKWTRTFLFLAAGAAAEAGVSILGDGLKSAIVADDLTWWGTVTVLLLVAAALAHVWGKD